MKTLIGKIFATRFAAGMGAGRFMMAAGALRAFACKNQIQLEERGC